MTYFGRYRLRRHHLYFLVASPVLSLSFALNWFQAATAEFFSQWQMDSDAIVVASILSRPEGLTILDWGLARNQQLGIQGHLFSMLWDFFNIVDFEILRSFSAALTGITLALVGAQIMKTGNETLAWILLFVSATSPWLVSAGRNLYWVPWTWFVPVVIVGLLYFSNGRKRVYLYHFFLFLAFMVKFSAGYEFTPSILIVCFIYPFVLGGIEKRTAFSLKEEKPLVFLPIIVGANGFTAFLTTFIFHASLRVRGDPIRGAIEIINEDVLRRTHGNPADFDPIFSGSLESSTLGVVMMYFNKWWTPFLEANIEGLVTIKVGQNGLIGLFALLGLSIVLRLLVVRKIQFGFFVLLLGAIAVPVSWLAIAKGHSAIHAHINYILWYPLPVAILLYLSWYNLKSIWSFRKKVSNSPRA